MYYTYNVLDVDGDIHEGIVSGDSFVEALERRRTELGQSFRKRSPWMAHRMLRDELQIFGQAV